MSDKMAETPNYSITAPIYFNDSVHKSLKYICKSALTDNTCLLESSKNYHENISENNAFRQMYANKFAWMCEELKKETTNVK